MFSAKKKLTMTRDSVLNSKHIPNAIKLINYCS